MSIGGGSNSSKTTTDQYNRSQSTNDAWGRSASQGWNSANSFVDNIQQGYLSRLYDMGMGATNPNATAAAARGAQGAMLPAMQTGMQNLGALTDTRGQIAAQEGSLRAGLSKLFTQDLMPSVKSSAMTAGGFGGGRQGVAEGVGMGQIADAYTAGLGDITARANQTAVSAASQLPGVAQGLYTAYTAPSMAGLDPLSRLAAIIGAPTVLQSSRGGTRSTGSTRSTGQSSTRSGTESQSKSSGWDFKAGLF